MNRINLLDYGNKKILEVDYTGLKEAEMITLLESVKQLLLSERKPYLILNHFNARTFITPTFIFRGKETTAEVMPYIEKMAFTGLSFTQKILLTGFNIAMQRNFKNFETREEALHFLLDSHSTDNDLPDYFRK